MGLLNVFDHAALEGENYYSLPYKDDKYMYRHVIIDKKTATNVLDLWLEQGKRFLLTEKQCCQVGICQSPGWEHYELHRPEPHVLLFRRPLPPAESELYGEVGEQGNQVMEQKVSRPGLLTLLEKMKSEKTVKSPMKDMSHLVMMSANRRLRCKTSPVSLGNGSRRIRGKTSPPALGTVKRESLSKRGAAIEYVKNEKMVTAKKTSNRAVGLI